MIHSQPLLCLLQFLFLFDDIHIFGCGPCWKTFKGDRRLTGADLVQMLRARRWLATQVLKLDLSPVHGSGVVVWNHGVESQRN